MRAYAYLQEQEVIFNKRGVGYFVHKRAKDRISSILKERFLKQELPELFRTIDLLNIDLNEIQKLYENYLAKKRKD